MALIPNGTYKIRNVEYQDYVADLINAVKGGPIQGYGESPSNTNDKWILVNVGDTGSQVTLESVSVPGYFANAQSISGGAELVGTTTKTVWNLIKVDRGYAIEAPGYYYIWKLLGAGDYVPIDLVGPNGQYDTQWTFESVSTQRKKKHFH